MVAPMSDAPPTDNPLDAIRGEVDRIDAEILQRVAERQRLADKIAALKPPQAGLPIRPGREVAMLRRLIAAAEAPLEREVILEIWRALIAANLRRQRVIDVVVGGGRGDPTRMFDIARRHFGARTRIQHVGEPQVALQRAAEKTHSCVAVTPWPTAPGVGSWWPALSESRFHALHLIAGLPLLGETEDPEACVFAASETEAAGDDVSLLLAFDPHHRVKRAMKEVRLNGKEVARSAPRGILRIDGFVALNDPRAAALTGHGLEGVRVLGSFARV